MIDIDFAQLRTIGLTQAIVAQLSMLEPQPAGAFPARVTEVHRDAVILHDGASERSARAMEALAVGDWVAAHEYSPGQLAVCAVAPPLTHLARRTSSGRRQSLASNVDTALLVMGLDHDFNLRRMERYLALVRTAGIDAVAVLTKADTPVDAEGHMQELRRRLPSTLPAFAINAHQPGDVLLPWLGAGQTLVLLGTSGAGKSTLTNALSGSVQETGGVRRGDGRGRHTTTARSLHLCSSGACIIDTPGLRTWSPDADEAALAGSFEDIDALAAQCQFRDCGHDAEPGCAVRGVVDDDRVRNYHKLLREARRGVQTPLEKIAERARWKVLHKAAHARTMQKGKTTG